MIQELVILGLLKSKSLSGYDIKKIIDKDLGVFSQLETKSIYYTLRKMEKDKFISKQNLVTDNYPQKYVYTITAKGENLFLKLYEEALSSTKRPFIELDIAIYFLPFVDKKRVEALLRYRLKFLERVKKWLLDKEGDFQLGPKNLKLLIQHHQKLATAEKEFLASMLKEIKGVR